MIPHTDYERLALLKEIEGGEKVVLPISLEHAECMLRVASMYINQHKKEMWDTLKDEL